MNYARFFAMIATSTVVMFGLMYLNTYLIDHVFWSETRAYMAILMGATMAFIMLAFMLSMYKNRTLNTAIFAGSVVVFAAALWLVRSQVTVQDRSYMSAMIPHHSIAIMTSTRAELSDPRVRTLADDIIYAQDKEIAEMRYLIADIAESGEAKQAQEPQSAALVSVKEALETEVVGKVDPEFLSASEIDKVFPQGVSCRFHYTDKSPAVLVMGESAEGPSALLKISGDLVRLEGIASADGAELSADGLSARINATEEDLYDLELAADDYEAGFRGLFSCAG